MPTKFDLSPKALVTNKDNRVLVIRRAAESVHWPNAWDLPGGKPDAGESFDQTLRREALEETGLRIEVTHFIGAAEYDFPHVRVVFLVMAATVLGGELQVSREHSAAEWVELSALRSLDLVEPIARALARHDEDLA